MSYTAVPQQQRVRLMRAPNNIHRDSDDEEEEEEQVYEDEDQYGDDDNEPEEEEEEEEEDDEEDAEPRPPPPLLVIQRSRAQKGRKSIGGKAPRKSIAAQASNRRKKKRAREPYEVAKEKFNREGDREKEIYDKFCSEIANRSQTLYKEQVIKPSGDRPGKIVTVFRDRPCKESFISTREDLKKVLRGELEDLKVFEIVLQRGQRTVKTDTLKVLHITGWVYGEDIDPYPMGGATAEPADDYSNNVYHQSFSNFDRDTRANIKTEGLTFRLEINGRDWRKEGSVEEMFYFLIQKNSKDPNSRRRKDKKRPRTDPLREAFQAQINAEKTSRDNTTWPHKYNYSRDVLIMQLGNYIAFLHNQLSEEIGYRVPLIPFNIIRAWLSTLIWDHIYE